jgi:hypothetical protein
VRRIALALGLALTAAIAAVLDRPPILAVPVVGEAPWRFESKLGGSHVLDGFLSLGDINAPPTLADGAPTTATLYYLNREVRTIETTAYTMTDIEALRGEPPRKIVAIKVPNDVDVTQLAKVVVILGRPVTK